MESSVEEQFRYRGSNHALEMKEKQSGSAGRYNAEDTPQETRDETPIYKKNSFRSRNANRKILLMRERAVHEDKTEKNGSTIRIHCRQNEGTCRLVRVNGPHLSKLGFSRRKRYLKRIV